jgi:hypothetical protein
MQHQSQNNMITPIDKIPLKTSGANITEDMTDDPIVKDVLNEFEKELSLNEQTIKNNYLINNNQHQQQQPPQNYQQPLYHPLQQQLQPQLQQQSSKINYIDNELITKTFIICIVIAIIINPIIYNTILSKIPENISGMLDNYNYIIKIILIFIALYALMFYKLL